jgi:hypothetical protein
MSLAEASPRGCRTDRALADLGRAGCQRSKRPGCLCAVDINMVRSTRGRVLQHGRALQRMD